MRPVSDNTRTAGAIVYTFLTLRSASPISVDNSNRFASFSQFRRRRGAFSLRAVFPVTGDVLKISAVESRDEEFGRVGNIRPNSALGDLCEDVNSLQSSAWPCGGCQQTAPAHPDCQVREDTDITRLIPGSNPSPDTRISIARSTSACANAAGATDRRLRSCTPPSATASRPGRCITTPVADGGSRALPRRGREDARNPPWQISS